MLCFLEGFLRRPVDWMDDGEQLLSYRRKHHAAYLARKGIRGELPTSLGPNLSGDTTDLHATPQSAGAGAGGEGGRRGKGADEEGGEGLRKKVAVHAPPGARAARVDHLDANHLDAKRNTDGNEADLSMGEGDDVSREDLLRVRNGRKPGMAGDLKSSPRPSPLSPAPLSVRPLTRVPPSSELLPKMPSATGVPSSLWPAPGLLRDHQAGKEQAANNSNTANANRLLPHNANTVPDTVPSTVPCEAAASAPVENSPKNDRTLASAAEDLSDAEMALRLQEEEDARFAQELAAREGGAGPPAAGLDPEGVRAPDQQFSERLLGDGNTPAHHTHSFFGLGGSPLAAAHHQQTNAHDMHDFHYNAGGGIRSNGSPFLQPNAQGHGPVQSQGINGSDPGPYESAYGPNSGSGMSGSVAGGINARGFFGSGLGRNSRPDSRGHTQPNAVGFARSPIAPPANRDESMSMHADDLTEEEQLARAIEASKRDF